MTATFPDTEVQPQSESGASSEELLELGLLEVRDELRRQGQSMRSTQQKFSIFALLAFLLSMATLLAVAFKLDNTDTKTTGVNVPAAAAAASPSAPALPHRVGVSLREFKVDVTASAAAAGKVRFNVRNTGAVTHEFVVLRTAKPAGSLLKGARADERGNVGETGDLAAGASKTITVTLKPGHYALICNLPGHYVGGQHTDFTVR
jgi:uncharacterized cupredoxin-like copper-binding protein